MLSSVFCMIPSSWTQIPTTWRNPLDSCVRLRLFWVTSYMGRFILPIRRRESGLCPWASVCPSPGTSECWAGGWLRWWLCHPKPAIWGCGWSWASCCCPSQKSAHPAPNSWDQPVTTLRWPLVFVVLPRCFWRTDLPLMSSCTTRGWVSWWLEWFCTAVRLRIVRAVWVWLGTRKSPQLSECPIKYHPDAHMLHIWRISSHRICGHSSALGLREWSHWCAKSFWQ